MLAVVPFDDSGLAARILVPTVAVTGVLIAVPIVSLNNPTLPSVSIENLTLGVQETVG